MSRIQLTSATGATFLALLFVANAWAAGLAPPATVCDRTCWAARAPQCSISQMTGLTRAVIHHTASASDYDTTSLDDSKALVRAIQNYHMDVNGWCDIGYHFVTDKLGNNFEGREGSLTSLPRGAHDGINDNSFGFCMMGYYHSPYNQVPTTEGKTAQWDLIAWRMPDPFTGFGSGPYGSNSDVGFVCGHRDVEATACPGDLLYQYIGTDFYGGEYRTQINDRIVNGTGGPTPTPTPTPIPGTDVIVDNDDGAPGYTETGAWTTSTSNGYNGGTYRFANTTEADTASWTANLADTAYYEVSVIFRASTNRATSAHYTIAGQDFYVDQTQNNLVWVTLGTVSLTAGDNTLVLDAAGSSPSGTVVIADAVHFVEVTAPTPSPTPTATPTPTSVHVDSIALTTVAASKGNKYGEADVTIVDDLGNPVAGANVSGTFTGSYAESVTATTDATGVAVLQTTGTAKGGVTFTFCVDNVAASLPYDSGDNLVTCASY